MEQLKAFGRVANSFLSALKLEAGSGSTFPTCEFAEPELLIED
jgi:hypothetical protein